MGFFNGKNADKLIDFYTSSHNRVDVAVVYKMPKSKRKTTLCPFEVHSSPYVHTVRKLVYALVALLRVVKAHQIHECHLIGFAFPKLAYNIAVIKVKASYFVQEKNFQYSAEAINNVSKIKTEISNALTFNKKTLNLCSKAQFKAQAIHYVLTYSPKELKEYGENAVQLNCHYGVLIQAEIDSKLCCIKKPILESSLCELTNLCRFTDGITGIIQYKAIPGDLKVADTVCYTKVKHDPLNGEELIKCLYYFVSSVFSNYMKSMLFTEILECLTFVLMKII